MKKYEYKKGNPYYLQNELSHSSSTMSPYIHRKDNPYYNSDELYHHGIIGMHWGEKNGPPYPLGSGGRSSEEKKHTGGTSKYTGTSKEAVDNRSASSTSSSDSKSSVDKRSAHDRGVAYRASNGLKVAPAKNKLIDIGRRVEASPVGTVLGAGAKANATVMSFLTGNKYLRSEQFFRLLDKEHEAIKEYYMDADKLAAYKSDKKFREACKDTTLKQRSAASEQAIAKANEVVKEWSKHHSDDEVDENGWNKRDQVWEDACDKEFIRILNKMKSAYENPKEKAQQDKEDADYMNNQLQKDVDTLKTKQSKSTDTDFDSNKWRTALNKTNSPYEKRASALEKKTTSSDQDTAAENAANYAWDAELDFEDRYTGDKTSQEFYDQAAAEWNKVFYQIYLADLEKYSKEQND